MSSEPGYRLTFALAPHARTQAVRDLAGREGWELIVDVPRGHRKWRRLVWRAPGEVEVHYLEDHVSGTRFLVPAAASADVASVDALAARVSAAVPLEDEAAVLGRLEAAEDPGEIIAALLTLGTFLNGFTTGQPATDSLVPRLVPVVARLAGHPVRQVRRAVLITMGDLASRLPELAAPILARQDQETELAGLMDAFAHVVGEAS